MGVAAYAYIEAGRHITVKGWVPRTGVVGFQVVSAFPVNTYVVNQEGYDQFLRGERFTYYGGFSQELQHFDQVQVPFLGIWYLIVYNPNLDVVSVGYATW